MVKMDKVNARDIIGLNVVSKSGKRFGVVGDLVFEARTGEIINIILKNPTVAAKELDLEKDDKGNLLIPYNSVIAIEDLVIIAEEDIIWR